ncbi:MAG: FAD-dependent oxidoreductase [Eubacteriales bacterium]|nr:FAD-dependent oxidoreductase [Eubacteriales bacterium]
MGKELYGKCFDVVVVGGGVSGCTAALAAARNGASVLVLERSGCLGGSLTGCGVGPMMTFHAGDKQIITGIMEELVAEMVSRGCSIGHILDNKQYTSTITPFQAEGLKLVLDEKLIQAGCQVLLHTFTGAVTREGSGITGLTVCNKDGLNTVRGKIYIDATGDGDIAAWAGAEMTKGRPEDGAAQPMTMNMKYCGVDTEALRSYILNNPDRFAALMKHGELIPAAPALDIQGFEEEFLYEKAQGRLSIPRENVLLFGTGRPGEYIVNTTRIVDHDGTDAASLSDAEVLGRRQCAQLDVFLRKYVPGFENAMVEFTGPTVGIRGSRQLVGCYTLTAQDILSCRTFPDRVCHTAYPIDIHNPKGEGTASTFMSTPGSYYAIPYSIMVCNEVDNLIVTGRCVSATFEAQAAIRTTPTVGAMGQAAGTAAAMAARESVPARLVDVPALQQALVSQGAYLEI